MIARVQNLVKLNTDSELMHFSLELPELLTPEMIRDGIIQKSADSDLGDRSSWLLQMLTATPSDFWTKQFSLSTSDLVKAAIHPKSDSLLERGMTLAAAKTGDLIWIQTFLNVYTSKKKKNEIFAVLSIHGAKLISKVLSDPSQQIIWLEIIKNPDLEFSNIQALILLGGDTQRNYSPELSQAVMELIDRNIDNLIQDYPNTRQNYWSFCEFIRKSSIYIAPALILSVISRMQILSQQLQQSILASKQKNTNLDHIQESLQNLIDCFIQVLQLRQEMIKSTTDRGVTI